MTTVNRMIRDAKNGASVVFIRENEVRGLAEYVRVTISYPSTHSNIDSIAEGIRNGDLSIMGVPVKIKAGEKR